MILFLLLIVLILAGGSGYYYGAPRYGYAGWSPLALVLVIIVLAYLLGYLPLPTH